MTSDRKPVVEASPEITAAVERGATYLQQRLGSIDPIHLSAIDYLYRNWSLSALGEANMLAESTYAKLVAGEPWPYVEFALPDETLALERLVNPTQRVPPPVVTAGVLEPTGQFLAQSLYCDTVPLSENDLQLWDQATLEGGYFASHVLLAAWWAQSIGCGSPAMTAATERAISAVAAEFSARVGVAPSVEVVDDLSLEQAAFLAQMGETSVLGSAWVSAVLSAQQPDGGWTLAAGGGDGARSHWHATLLAVWMLSLASEPGSGVSWAR